MSRKLLFPLIFLVCFVGGLAASHWWKNYNSTLSESTVVFPTARDLPSFSVLDHTGKTASNDDLLGRWSLMFFGFTHCPDVCPNTLNALTGIQKDLEHKNQPQLVLVSVDPMRDTPEILNTYIRTFADDIKGYTGELHQIQTLTEYLGVAYAYNAMPDGSYTVDHTAAIFIINPEGKYVGTYTNMLNSPEDVKNLKNDLKKLSQRN